MVSRVRIVEATFNVVNGYDQPSSHKLSVQNTDSHHEEKNKDEVNNQDFF